MITATAMLERNTLDAWAAQRIGIAGETLAPDAIAEYQLAALRQTAAWARRRSSFYAARLAAFPGDWPRSLAEFAQAPLTSSADIIERGHEFLCVPQSEIRRVVSLESSGTSGMRKRIFFTAEDQELALDFFANGVASMAAHGDRMLIALPGEREGSVGFQLARGIARAGIVPVPHGFSFDPSVTVQRMDEEKSSLLIGLPVQMLAVALQRGKVARRVFRRLRSIVLCSDHVPQTLAQRIRQATGCEIFEHYGSTEMGLGGGVDCRAHAGYHLREADLYFEIVSPHTGKPLADAQMGEVVFTTLGRFGMPLVRYRTGDLGRILPGPCTCGSPLRRLARVQSRIDAAVAMGSKGSLTIAALDEALFAISEVYDFAVELVPGNPNELQVRIYAPHTSQDLAPRAESALMQQPAIAANCVAGDLRLSVLLQDQPFPVTGAKRKIEVRTLP
jgi:phenylacetate-coenzyme A ligase PaaK-like adenylate-forming protein